MNAKPGKDTVAKEQTYLSKKVPNNILSLQCQDYLENSYAVYQTIASSPFYLKSVRKLEYLNDRTCEFIYAIEFDDSVVKHELEYALPKFIVEFVTMYNMKKYLIKLKNLLDHN